MWTNLRFKLAQWIVPKHWQITPLVTVVVNNPEVFKLIDDFYSPDEASAQANWRKVRKQLVGDHHEP